MQSYYLKLFNMCKFEHDRKTLIVLRKEYYIADTHEH